MRTPAFLGFELAFQCAVETGDVRARPPMSKPIDLPNPARRATREKPITPPAGPDKMLSFPTNAAAVDKPAGGGHQLKRPASPGIP